MCGKKYVASLLDMVNQRVSRQRTSINRVVTRSHWWHTPLSPIFWHFKRFLYILRLFRLLKVAWMTYEIKFMKNSTETILSEIIWREHSEEGWKITWISFSFRNVSASSGHSLIGCSFASFARSAVLRPFFRLYRSLFLSWARGTEE